MKISVVNAAVSFPGGKALSCSFRIITTPFTVQIYRAKS